VDKTQKIALKIYLYLYYFCIEISYSINYNSEGCILLKYFESIYCVRHFFERILHLLWIILYGATINKFKIIIHNN
jgi:hypothetical protein